jgi:hypothetical protein
MKKMFGLSFPEEVRQQYAPIKTSRAVIFRSILVPRNTLISNIWMSSTHLRWRQRQKSHKFGRYKGPF